ncbi:MAG: UDP-N-acetylmuramoyl-tripeptide--D-alanyl-D-alanine ligase [Opitutaceae bacterium]
MPVFDPQLLAADCGGRWHGAPTVPVSGFSIDTRTIQGGDLFIALRTDRRDGHEFLGLASAAGASGAVVSRELPEQRIARLQVLDTLEAFQAMARAHRRRFAGRVAGVTGSAGKTSTKDLLAAILGEPGEVLATEGNLNNHLGVPLTLLRLDPARHACAVVEAGINAPGEMDVLGSIIQPEVALITTVAAAHLERLGSIERVGEEKARLAAHLMPGGAAVFPAACLAYPGFNYLAARSFVAVSSKEAGTRLPSGATGILYTVTNELAATAIALEWAGVKHEFSFRRLTRGMAANAALAVITALHLGVGADDIRRRLVRWHPAALRGEVIEEGGRLVYLDCYNANPASMLDALDGFLALAPPSACRLFVIGCMEELGTESAALHRAVGAAWPMRAEDRLFIFGKQADAFAEGLQSAHAVAQVAINPERGEVEAAIAAARGAIFLKGSRAYRLETLVQPSVSGERHEKETAA